MSSPILQPPRCRHCTSIIDPPGDHCGRCGQSQMPSMYPPAMATAPKSPGLAAFLSFVWLGVGHLYVGQVTAGVLLIAFDFVLLLLSLTGIGLVVSLPVWIIAVIVTMITSANAATAHNTRGALGYAGR